MSVYFFGCWNKPGHFLYGPRGAYVYMREIDIVTRYRGGDGKDHHLDSTLAPRELGGRIIWKSKAGLPSNRNGSECAQGQFLRHVLSNGFTALQWWDRCQGDTRGACNSTVLVEGERTTEEMLAALRENFPSVVENLERAGVKLVEVFP